MEKSTYLGDGAHATITDRGVVIITGNHHDPQQATDTVILGGSSIKQLSDWYNQKLEELKAKQK